MPAPTNSRSYCGEHCPLEGGDTQARNPCPFMDQCAQWADDQRFEAQLHRERMERLVREHPEMFR